MIAAAPGKARVWWRDKLENEFDSAYPSKIDLRNFRGKEEDKEEIISPQLILEMQERKGRIWRGKTEPIRSQVGCQRLKMIL
jgi:maltooligosyltrehalose synthase